MIFVKKKACIIEIVFWRFQQRKVFDFKRNESIDQSHTRFLI